MKVFPSYLRAQLPVSLHANIKVLTLIRINILAWFKGNCYRLSNGLGAKLHVADN